MPIESGEHKLAKKVVLTPKKESLENKERSILCGEPASG